SALPPMTCVNCQVRSAELGSSEGSTLSSALDPGDEFTALLEVDALAPGRFTIGFNLVAADVQAVPAPTFQQVSTRGYQSCGLRTDGSIACWGWDWDGRISPPPGNNYTQVSTASWDACALRDDGSITCWGFNDSGELDPPA